MTENLAFILYNIYNCVFIILRFSVILTATLRYKVEGPHCNITKAYALPQRGLSTHT